MKFSIFWKCSVKKNKQHGGEDREYDLFSKLLYKWYREVLGNAKKRKRNVYSCYSILKGIRNIEK